MEAQVSARYRVMQQHRVLSEVVTRPSLTCFGKHCVFLRCDPWEGHSGWPPFFGCWWCSVHLSSFWPVVQKNMVKTLFLCCGLVVPLPKQASFILSFVEGRRLRVSLHMAEGSVLLRGRWGKEVWDRACRPLRSTTESLQPYWHVDGYLLYDLISQGLLLLCKL